MFEMMLIKTSCKNILKLFSVFFYYELLKHIKIKKM